MLNPKERKLYMDALHPPDGYELDRAIGTTFSLNLETLLLVPLAFTSFSIENKEAVLSEPLAVLDSLRRYASKISLFCQAGRISVPSTESRLFSILEEMIIEVNLNNYGVFHPKIWLLRFIGPNKIIKYRFICLSRNLTLDRSWDTILTLEGVTSGKWYPENKPLADFIKALPGLALNDLPRNLYKEINDIGVEVRHADLRLEWPFEERPRFYPVGMPGYKKIPLPDARSGILVISPFMSEKTVNELSKLSDNSILISRNDSLDELNTKDSRLLRNWDEILFLDNSIEDTNNDDDGLSNVDTKGLHAKIIIAEDGRKTFIRTGSANATDAAFYGSNIEFVVELTCNKSQINIKNILESKQDTSLSLKELCVPWEPIEIKKINLIEKELDDTCEQVRRELISAGLRGNIKSRDKDDNFDLTINIKECKSITDEVQVFIRPITLGKNVFQVIKRESKKIVFSNLTKAALTGFVAVDIIAKKKLKKRKVRFVLNVPLVGLPHDRVENLLVDILSEDKGQKFLRFLMFLLGLDGDNTFIVLSNASSSKLLSGGAWKTNWGDYFPLMETLVKAAAKNTEKIDDVRKLIEDLRKSEKSAKIFPLGFEELWTVIDTASKQIEMRAEEKS